MGCKKTKTYKTKIMAKSALSRLQGKRQKGRVESQIYWCTEHKGWHTTGSN